MTNEKIKEYSRVIKNLAYEIRDYVQAIEKELEKEG
jgi:hypothetical protein